MSSVADDDALAMGVKQVSKRWSITIAVLTSLVSGTLASYLTLQITQATQAEKIAALDRANVTILENIRTISAFQLTLQERTARLEARQETVFWALTDIRTAIKDNHALLLEHEKDSRKR